MSDHPYTCDRCEDEHDHETQALKCCVVGGLDPITDCARKEARRQRRAKAQRDADKQRKGYLGR